MAVTTAWTRALAVPMIGATAVTLCLFLEPRFAFGAAGAILIAGVGVAWHDAPLYRKAGLSAVPSIVGGVVSVVLAAGAGLAAWILTAAQSG